MNKLSDLQKEIKKVGNPVKAKILQRFFKTGKGEYGEGDVFLGITVPQSRSISAKFVNLPLKDIAVLLKSKIHEERLISLILLVHQYKKGSIDVKKEIYEFYIKNAKLVNNWDLVDLSAHEIIGAYLYEMPDKVRYDTLKRLAHSDNLWERRISIVATWYFIRNKKLDETFKIAKILLHDKHDLIQKAVGWMLREAGKKDQKAEETFLNKYYKTMPRTMLRYAIERFPDILRLSYLRGDH